MSQRTDNVNVSLFFTHFYLVLKIVSEICWYDEERAKSRTKNTKKKAEAAMKRRIATETNGSIDKAGRREGIT